MLKLVFGSRPEAFKIRLLLIEMKARKDESKPW